MISPGLLKFLASALIFTNDGGRMYWSSGRKVIFSVSHGWPTFRIPRVQKSLFGRDGREDTTTECLMFSSRYFVLVVPLLSYWECFQAYMYTHVWYILRGICYSLLGRRFSNIICSGSLKYLNIHPLEEIFTRNIVCVIQIPRVV